MHTLTQNRFINLITLGARNASWAKKMTKLISPTPDSLGLYLETLQILIFLKNLKRPYHPDPFPGEIKKNNTLLKFLP